MPIPAVSFQTTRQLTIVFCVSSDYKCLRQVDYNTQSKVETLLTKNLVGSGGWKQVAIKYGMDEVGRGWIEMRPDAGKIIIGYINATQPDLTVYEFCKTLKEPNIRRFDVVKELLGHLSVPSSEKTTVSVSSSLFLPHFLGNVTDFG